MAPATRSARATSSKVKVEDVSRAEEEEMHLNGDRDDGEKVDAGITVALDFASQLQNTLRNLRKDVATLQKKNKELQEDLDEARENAENQTQPKRGHKGGPTVKQLQVKVTSLRKQVNELEQRRERDRRKIAQLQAKEIRKDAKDLQDQTDFEIGDTAHQMRKLLRKFHDIMLSGSIEDGEECAICMTQMEVGKAYSYSCEHTFCTECTKQLAPMGYEDSITCPTCRKVVSKDDMDVIEYTASQQWDALLAVAERWAKMDRRRELETSDEEEEENWLDDGNGTSDAKASSPEPEPEQDDASSPPPAPGKRRLKPRAVLRAPSVASSVPGEEEIALEASQAPEQAHELEAQDKNEDQEPAQADVEPHQAEESQGTDGRLTTPTPESGTSQVEDELPVLYSQSPRDVKKRKMQELAEAARSKKRRTY